MYEKTKWNKMKKICTLQKLTQKEVSIAILILDKKKNEQPKSITRDKFKHLTQ